MKRFYLLFFLILTVLTATGCRVFDWFSKDSTSQQNSSSYAPPLIPETLEQEQPVVKARLNELSQAFIDKDVDRAIKFCVKKDLYKQIFLRNKDRLPELGAAIKTGRLTSVGAGYSSSGTRIGEISVEIGSSTFGITIFKEKGEWFFQDL
ncbi:MAG: hypothetical protein AB1403_05480 [Candidatus Riflebacteria bacterium]